jgi:hypothetical protein
MGPEHIKILLVTIVLIALLLNSCSSGREPPTENPPTASFPGSAKGYELYSWRAGREWYYTLTTGTDRVKTYQEVTAGENTAEDDWVKITVKGTHDLENTLDRLPPNTQVAWLGPRRLKRMGVKPGDLALPAKKTIEDIQLHCQELSIQLEISR